MNFIPVILGGGSGSRLWPLSRELFPKPFVPLPDGETLIRKTYARALSLPDVKHIMTIVARDLMFQTIDEYELVPSSTTKHSFILEPFGKNTAAAIALACLNICEQESQDTVVLVMPSDHLIDGREEFQSAITAARCLAMQGKIVTFGVPPDRPETDFGYIRSVDNEVIQFIEKPTEAAAECYLKSGHFFWNSGMLCFPVKIMIEAMKEHCPQLLVSVKEAFFTSRKTISEQTTITEINRDEFSNVPSISIDYAVMEKHSNAGFVPCSFSWSDVGSFSRFAELFDADEDGNQVSGKAVLQDTSNSFIHGAERVIALNGIENLIVVDTADALLISNKQTKHSQDLYKKLAVHQTDITRKSNISYRPWGKFSVLEESSDYKVKKLEIHAKAFLSLQSHQFRSEYWFVVKGSASIQIDDTTSVLNENEFTYIPAGSVHRLGNNGDDLLIVIEIQKGKYLREDDITRFEDIYGRVDI